MTISNCTIAENEVGQGSLFGVRAGSIIISDCTIDNDPDSTLKSGNVSGDLGD